MTQFELPFRLHGKLQIETRYEFDDVVVRPGPSHNGIAGVIGCRFEAADRHEARNMVDGRFRTKASNIASIMSFTLNEGIYVGRKYNLISVDSEGGFKMDSVLNAGEWELSLCENVYSGVSSKMYDDTQIKRALIWYSNGVASYNPEIRIIFYWTALETLATKTITQFNFSDFQKDVILKARDNISDVIVQPELKSWIHGFFGEILTETKSQSDLQAVMEYVSDQVPEDAGSRDVEEIAEQVYRARNDLVHSGSSLDDARSIASDAEKLIHDSLAAELPQAFAGIISDDVPSWIQHKINYEEWMPILFEDNYDLELDRWEVKRRLFALTRDFSDVNHSINLFAGEGMPLNYSEETDSFSLDPEFEFEYDF